MKKTAIFTSCATNYIPKARVLAESLRRHHPEGVELFLLVTDTLPPNFSIENEAFDQVVTAESLEIPDFNRWIFGHRIVEACTAVKPFMLRHLLNQGYENVLYFDPDIAIFSSLEPILQEFSEHSLLLTPHINEPEATVEAVADNELSVLKHGLYNFGFVGVKNDSTGMKYANWWADRCYFRCFDDIIGGNFTDQKWNDLVPIFFDHVKVMKHPGMNVATWNYAQRQLAGTLAGGGEISVNGQPLIFHHFTGFDSGAHEAMRDKYGSKMPAALELSQWYVDSCNRYAEEALESIPWHYGQYNNGQIIAPHHRVLYRERKDLQESFPNPFEVADKSFYAWLEAEDLIKHAPLMPNNHRSFSSFLQDTKAECEGYISRTERLAHWQKRGILAVSDGIFGAIGKLSRRRKSAA